MVAIRVIAYEIDDKGRPQAGETTYRLITMILDPDSAPASRLFRTPDMVIKFT
ncbi:MAG: hypothetical protein ACYDEY_08800 [Acidimicrobiales bacterium]